MIALKKKEGLQVANKRSIKVLLACLLAAMVIDGLITWFFIANGLAMEGNPFLRYWVRADFFLPLKLAMGLIIVYALWTVYQWYPRAVTWCSILLLAIYIAVIGWNILALI